MNNYSIFHDGFVDGLLIGKESVTIFLSTSAKASYVLIADDVLRMRVDNFREGNIIYDVLTREGEELTVHDIESLYGMQSEATGEVNVRRVLERVVSERRIVLEINPSYGCQCLMLAQAFTLRPRKMAMPECR